MSGVNKFSGKGQAKIHHVVPYYWPIAKENLAPSEKITPNEEVEKGTNLLDCMEDPVNMIHRKGGLDHFQGKYAALTGWLNLYHERLKHFYT